MREKKQFTCIICPAGCRLTAEMEDGKVISVLGNSCRRGETYARSEAADPRRGLSTTVRITGGELSVLPVKAAGGVPKAKIFDIMAALSRVTLRAPVFAGEIVLPDACGTGIDIVSAADMPESK